MRSDLQRTWRAGHAAISALLLAGAASAQGAPAPAKRAAPPPTVPAPAAPTTLAVTLTTVEARLVGIEDGLFVVDVGGRSGARAGLVAELWRPLKLRNPATGRTVEDRYRIGSLRLTEALDIVSFASPEGEMRQPPKPGDIIVVRVEAPRVEPPPAGKPGAAPAVPAPVVVGDGDSTAVSDLLESLRGESPESRAARMEQWVEGHRQNRFAAAVTEEAQMLRASVAAPAPAVATGASLDLGEPAVTRFLPPKEGLAGAPLELGVELEGDVRGAVLHVRHTRDVAYVSVAMRPAGEGFWVATVTADQVRAPSLQYFIEAVRGSGETIEVVGTESQPLTILTPDAPKPAPPLPHRSIVSVHTDYADYNRFRGNDRVWQTEGFFGMRFQDEGVRAVRTGFGVFRGEGGSVEELDVLKLEPRAVGLTYGYLEGELGFSRTVSFVGRVAVGLGEGGVAGGGQAHLRIGNDLDTNLMVGGEVLGGIGLRGMAQLELAPQGPFPFLVRTEVTNQPAGERASRTPGPGVVTAVQTTEVGGRIVLQPGVRIGKPVVVFARVSGEGRTINHAGLGFGGGVTVEW